MKPDGRREQNSFLRKKKKCRNAVGRKKERKKRKCYECQAKSQESAPFHTIVISIPQRMKEQREKRKVTLQWP